MFLKLPHVQDAARELLGEGLARRDSALLVDYDTEPRLIRPPTRDLAAVSRDLDVLRADGGSNLMRAVVFSLAQLAPLPGRKALVLYSDGVDEGEDVPYHQALRAAKQSGVPLYLILTNSAAGRAERKGILDFALRSYTERLERLAGATGGKLYAVGPRADVRAVYREILEELRSQYVVSFYPDPAAPTAEVQVEVARPGLTARTLRVPGSGSGR
jgi:VWFA-related protein